MGRRYTQEGYFATSVFKEIAVREFTGANGALLKVSLPAGLPGLWVGGIGWNHLRGQGELLLDDGLQIGVVGHEREGRLAVLSVEIARI